MSSTASSINENGVDWGTAIMDAETEKIRLQRRLKELQLAIRLLKRNQAEGLPWPKGQDLGQK